MRHADFSSQAGDNDAEDQGGGTLTCQEQDAKNGRFRPEQTRLIFVLSDHRKEQLSQHANRTVDL